MKLHEWINEAGINVPDVARLAGVPASSVYRWLDGGMSVQTMALVMSITAGAVTPLDYYPAALPVGKSAHCIAAQRRVNASVRAKSRIKKKAPTVPKR